MTLEKSHLQWPSDLKTLKPRETHPDRQNTGKLWCLTLEASCAAVFYFPLAWGFNQSNDCTSEVKVDKGKTDTHVHTYTQVYTLMHTLSFSHFLFLLLLGYLSFIFSSQGQLCNRIMTLLFWGKKVLNKVEEGISKHCLNHIID